MEPLKFTYAIIGGGLAAGYAAQVFAEANIPPQVVAIFAKESVPPYERPPLSKDFLEGVILNGPEEVVLNAREIYIHYPNGMGRSKLKLPQADKGTVRNINTLNKLIALSVD